MRSRAPWKSGRERPGLFGCTQRKESNADHDRSQTAPHERPSGAAVRASQLPRGAEQVVSLPERRSRHWWAPEGPVSIVNNPARS